MWMEFWVNSRRLSIVAEMILILDTEGPGHPQEVRSAPTCTGARIRTPGVRLIGYRPLWTLQPHCSRRSRQRRLKSQGRNPSVSFCHQSLHVHIWLLKCLYGAVIRLISQLFHWLKSVSLLKWLRSTSFNIYIKPVCMSDFLFIHGPSQSKLSSVFFYESHTCKHYFFHSSFLYLMKLRRINPFIKNHLSLPNKLNKTYRIQSKIKVTKRHWKLIASQTQS